jgi:hypothetical protein
VLTDFINKDGVSSKHLWNVSFFERPGHDNPEGCHLYIRRRDYLKSHKTEMGVK